MCLISAKKRSKAELRSLQLPQFLHAKGLGILILINKRLLAQGCYLRLWTHIAWWVSNWTSVFC